VLENIGAPIITGRCIHELFDILYLTVVLSGSWALAEHSFTGLSAL
jgi:hypothetical protein